MAFSIPIKDVNQDAIPGCIAFRGEPEPRRSLVWRALMLIHWQAFSRPPSGQDRYRREPEQAQLRWPARIRTEPWLHESVGRSLSRVESRSRRNPRLLLRRGYSAPRNRCRASPAPDMLRFLDRGRRCACSSAWRVDRATHGRAPQRCRSHSSSPCHTRAWTSPSPST